MARIEQTLTKPANDYDVVQKKKQLASIEDLQEKHRYNKFGKRVLERTDLGQYINMEA